MNRMLPQALVVSVFLIWCSKAPAAELARAADRFEFRTPRAVAYRFDESAPNASRAGSTADWLEAWPEKGSTNRVRFGSRVVLQLANPLDLERLTSGTDLVLLRAVTSNIFILQAPDAWRAARAAGRLAALPEVLASYPVLRGEGGVHGPYAYKPNATYFNLFQYYLENRNPASGARWGADINVRGAWPVTRGADVTVAVCDSGFELDHPDLAAAASGAPHFNFETGSTNGAPPTSSLLHNHGTSVAGFLAAQSADPLSILGTAPEAKLASWVIFGTNDTLVSDENLMDMYQHLSNSVAVQIHSWGEPDGVPNLYAQTLLEGVGISNATTFGRGGRGVVMVRSCGNNRGIAGNANDDAHCSDPRVVGVASVRVGGRAADYSSPGASVLVSAVGGQLGDAYELTTDRQGAAGYSALQIFYPVYDPSFWNFFLSFYGTSAAAPQIAGVATLMLSANPNLTYRDVQQILILSSRHFDAADPDLATNGAGLVVSHNDGFGVPDAGVAVSLARSWVSRPALTSVTVTATSVAAIPDDGLRLLVSGDGVPANLVSIHALPGTGPHADSPTPMLPLVDVGLATNAIGMNLTNQAALIERGVNAFSNKITLAAQAGAAFAVVYNYPTNVDSSGGDQLMPMGATDFAPIPAVFIGNRDGEALKAVFATNPAARAQIRLNSTNEIFTVTNTLLCEHVGLRVMTDHPLRGDLRITLVSPSGTRSVLQRYNSDESPGPGDWTYYSTHHFYESSAGDWTACFSDEGAGNTGSVLSVSLMLEGVPITDSDHDGLDDNWEFAHFGNLAQGPQDDPDHDGYSNMREQILVMNPVATDAPFTLDLSRWNQALARLSWPGSPDSTYGIWSGTDATAPLTLVTNLAGRFPEMEWFTGYTNLPQCFFQVRAVPNP